VHANLTSLTADVGQKSESLEHNEHALTELLAIALRVQDTHSLPRYALPWVPSALGMPSDVCPLPPGVIFPMYALPGYPLPQICPSLGTLCPRYALPWAPLAAGLICLRSSLLRGPLFRVAPVPGSPCSW